VAEKLGLQQGLRDCAQLTLISGFSARGLYWWSRFATSSLPVPLSPVMSTVLRVGATWRTTSRSFAKAGLRPMTSAGWLSVLRRFLRVRFSRRNACTSSVRATSLVTSFRRTGFAR